MLSISRYCWHLQIWPSDALPDEIWRTVRWKAGKIYTHPSTRRLCSIRQGCSYTKNDIISQLQCVIAMCTVGWQIYLTWYEEVHHYAWHSSPFKIQWLPRYFHFTVYAVSVHTVVSDGVHMIMVAVMSINRYYSLHHQKISHPIRYLN